MESPNVDAANGSVLAIMSDPSVTTTHALVAYLRMEADLADEKAKRLRAQADALAERFGVTDDMQSHYELNPDQLPPMDENGVPKYRGKKRGRKPKPRKRQRDPNRRKRQHTAYTLFVQETYPGVKEQHPDLQSKDVISIVARQWKEFSLAEKGTWKERAKATHADEEEEDDTEIGESAGHEDEHDHQLEAVGEVDGEAEATAAADAVYQQTVAEMADAAVEEDEDEELEEEDDDEEDEGEEEEVPPPPPTRRRRGRPKKT
jgi:HMG (high mobility group) box